MNIIQRIKTSLFVAATLLMIAAPAVISTSVAYAACSNIAKNVGSGATAASGDPTDCGTGTGLDGGGLAAAAGKIVTIFSMIVGAIAIIMVIYGGFRYITSGGDSGRVGNAKNTLIYAIVGLVIVAFAQVIVHFVLNQSGDIVQ